MTINLIWVTHLFNGILHETNTDAFIYDWFVDFIDKIDRMRDRISWDITVFRAFSVWLETKVVTITWVFSYISIFVLILNSNHKVITPMHNDHLIYDFFACGIFFFAESESDSFHFHSNDEQNEVMKQANQMKWIEAIPNICVWYW